MPEEPEFLDEAREEFEDAVEWYKGRNPRAAAAFVAEVRAAVARICEMPHTCSADVAGAQRVLLQRFPYKVVYRMSGDRVVIVAVAHQKRVPGYWRHR